MADNLRYTPRVRGKGTVWRDTWLDDGLRRSQPIETKAVTPVGESVNAAEHRRYYPKPVSPAIKNIMRIWYLTASTGGRCYPLPNTGHTGHVPGGSTRLSVVREHA
jgi:hypothetical protein